MNYDLLQLVFRAYFDVRKGKRSTANQLRYEIDMERNLTELYDAIVCRTYIPSRSICFMLDELDIRREIFAADFRDRVVHRLLYDQIAPLFEQRFIADSYSCRVGKGTHYGVRRLDHHIRSCSHNFTRPCHVLKMDIQGYFFAIDRRLLYERIRSLLCKKWRSYCAAQPPTRYMLDLDTILFLLERIIFHDPTQNCVVRGKAEEWAGFPANKSLFHAPPGHGLPIGNLTSQLFSNIYMDVFDQWVKRELRIEHYGRYVDDFFIVHEDREYLKSLIPVLRDFLRERLHLTLHPKKIYLQPVDRGVLFVGGYVKPHRVYPGSRSVSRFKRMLRDGRNKGKAVSSRELAASINSYLGTMKHYRCYGLRREIVIENLWIFRHGWIRNDYAKFIPSGADSRPEQVEETGESERVAGAEEKEREGEKNAAGKKTCIGKKETPDRCTQTQGRAEHGNLCTGYPLMSPEPTASSSPTPSSVRRQGIHR